VGAALVILLALVQAVVVGRVFGWERRVAGASHHLSTSLVAYAGAPLRYGIWAGLHIAGIGLLLLVAARFVEHRIAGAPAIGEKLARRGTTLAKWLYRVAWIQLVLTLVFSVPMARDSALHTLKSWGAAPAEADAPMALLAAGEALTTLCTSIMLFFSMALVALLIQVLLSWSPIGSAAQVESRLQIG